MRIALDATYSIGKELSGVGVYSNEILSGVTALQPFRNFDFYYRPHRFLPSFAERIPANAHRRLLLDAVPPIGAGLFHGLNQRLPKARARRTVCTFHDLFVMTGEYSTPEFRARFTQQAIEAAERSDLIIAVSAFTAAQASSLLKVDGSRIRVVHHGVHPPPRPVDDARRENMILHVGAIQRRKNVSRLVAAFESLPGGWKLVLAGSAGYGAAEILDHIEKSPARARIQVTGYVNNRTLEDLYRRASVFAFPSLDEGFGMPLLDAMARGVPVVTSDCSAMPEVAGDAALLVDPNRVESIEEGLRHLVLDTNYRKTLAAKGLRRVNGLTWRSAVEKTWAAYEALLS